IRHVLMLGPEITWIKLFRTGETGISVTEEPRLLKPLARHLHGRRKDRFRLSALSLRTVLDGIRARLDESREISRYMIGLLIFLGLLGTFWGLLGTVSAVGQVISGLDVSGGDVDLVFANLKAGLEAPLDGMGTAFSSSLFGLGGSLVLGFLDIQAGHAQNRFFNGLEEWLSGVTQLIDEPGTGARPRASEPLPEGEGGDEGEPAADPVLEEMRAQRRLLEALLIKKRAGDSQAPESQR
ncbi:MAG: flagellar motor protein MotA, partial [Pseudomonadota bacterium]|nr:flagellar motor protein MotA [Pseudomonadota bacterium]